MREELLNLFIDFCGQKATFPLTSIVQSRTIKLPRIGKHKRQKFAQVVVVAVVVIVVVVVVLAAVVMVDVDAGVAKS